MLRSWFFWLTLILAVISLGWFWLLSHELTFSRIEPEASSSAGEKGS